MWRNSRPAYEPHLEMSGKIEIPLREYALLQQAVGALAFLLENDEEWTLGSAAELLKEIQKFQEEPQALTITPLDPKTRIPE